MNPLDLALHWAREGFRVFPVGKNKVPLVKWKTEATDNRAKVWNTWQDHPDALVGMVIPEWMVVVDLDVKHADGPREWEKLCETQGAEPNGTMAVKTPSGGLHLYYNTGEPIANSVCKLGPSIDTRSSAHGKVGYVMAPGNPGYERINNDDPGFIPAFVPALVGATNSRKDEFDLGEVEWCEDYGLAARLLAKETFHDGERDNQLAHMAGILYRRAVHPDVAVEALTTKLEHDGWGSKEIADVERVVTSIYKRAKEAPGEDIGGDTPHDSDLGAMVTPEDVQKAEEEKLARRERFKPLTLDDLEQLPPPTWLIHKLIPDMSYGLMFGGYMTKKSFTAIDICMHLAHGLEDWHGYKIYGAGVPRTTVYVAGEGWGNMARRQKAWLKAKGLERNNHFWVIPDCPQIEKPEELVDMAEAIEDLNIKPDILVIDTLSYLIEGKNENDQSDMGPIKGFIRSLMKRWPGVTILLVTHSGKGDKDEARGHSTLTSDADFALSVKALDKHSIAVRTRKQKDGAEHDLGVDLESEVIELGEDEEGEVISSLVLNTAEVPIQTAERRTSLLEDAGTMSWGKMHFNERAFACWCFALTEAGKADWPELGATSVQMMNELGMKHEQTSTEYKKLKDEVQSSLRGYMNVKKNPSIKPFLDSVLANDPQKLSSGVFEVRSDNHGTLRTLRTLIEEVMKNQHDRSVL
jgi:KaiC/GvpD/RAD55 family RecA-like ATPase